jgi:RNA polymerase sigma factor (sigma-70 family)
MIDPARMDLVSLHARVRAGERDARAELVRRFLAPVRDLVHRKLDRDLRRRHPWLLPMLSTGDVVQDVLVGVVESLDRLEAPDDEAFTRYLATLVEHRLIDALRFHEAGRRDARRQVAPETGVLDRAGDDPTPSHTAAVAEQLTVFRGELEALPARERALLELRLCEETPYAEVAERLGFPSPDAARKAFHAAQARLVVRLRARGLRPPTGATEEH